MLAAQINAESPNANLPQITDTLRQKRIIAASPSVWLTPDRKYFDIDAAGKLSGWYDALNPGRFLPAGSAPPSVVPEAIATFTGSIVPAPSLGGSLLTVPAAPAAGKLAAGQQIMSGAAAGTTIVRQLTGADGGAGTYSVTVIQTVAATPMTASGYCSLNFTGVGAQSLVNDKGRDLLPASGRPATIVALVRNGAGAGAFGGGIMGSLAAANMMILYVDAGNANIGLQSRFNIAGQNVNGTTPLNDNVWHVVVGRYLGTGPGAAVRIDGVPSGQPVATQFTLVDDPAARKIRIGAYGAVESNPAKMRIAALWISEVDVDDPANLSLRTDVESEFLAFKAALG